MNGGGIGGALTSQCQLLAKSPELNSSGICMWENPLMIEFFSKGVLIIVPVGEW